jgi:hypothetical protein
MFWNQTRTDTESLGILYENMQNRTNSCVFRTLGTHMQRARHSPPRLIGDHFMETQKEWYNHKDNERLKHWEARYVPHDIFAITHSTVVYSDVVSYYNWHKGNLFGIEVYNQEIADAQRTFFEMLWQQSTPIDNAISQQFKKDSKD